VSRRLILGFVIALVLVGGGLGVAVAGGWLLHDSARPTKVADVVSRLRTSGSKGQVYVYATSGREKVNAFVSATHVYPRRTAVTIVRVACGERLTWDALEGRSNTWVLCRTPHGFEHRSEVEAHRFFGQSDRTTYACTGAVLGPGGKTFNCRSAAGRENGTIRVIAREKLPLGAALHVQTVGHVSGGDSGAETTDWWLAESGLPLRLAFASKTSRKIQVGRAHYSERADLRLVSTTPRS
jgi:hypothetical protein